MLEDIDLSFASCSAVKASVSKDVELFVREVCVHLLFLSEVSLREFSWPCSCPTLETGAAFSGAEDELDMSRTSIGSCCNVGNRFASVGPQWQMPKVSAASLDRGMPGQAAWDSNAPWNLGRKL